MYFTILIFFQTFSFHSIFLFIFIFLDQIFLQPFSHTSAHSESFLPSVIRDFNSLPEHVKSASSVSSFKRLLKDKSLVVPSYFYSGNRKDQILHTRLRTNCSAFAHDLYSKNIVPSPYCSCGLAETTYHYFFVCPKFKVARNSGYIQTIFYKQYINLRIRFTD